MEPSLFIKKMSLKGMEYIKESKKDKRKGGKEKKLSEKKKPRHCYGVDYIPSMEYPMP